MKFRIQVAHKGNIDDPWWEYYDKDDVVDNEPRPPLGSARRFCHRQRPLWQNDPERWGREMTEWFNSTLRPTEKPRVFLKEERIK